MKLMRVVLGKKTQASTKKNEVHAPNGVQQQCARYAWTSKKGQQQRQHRLLTKYLNPAKRTYTLLHSSSTGIPLPKREVST